MSTKKFQVVGLKGKDGVGISSVNQTTTSTESGGDNVITIELTDGNKTTVKIKNGKQGDKGDPGEVILTHDNNGNVTLEGATILIDGNEVAY